MEASNTKAMREALFNIQEYAAAMDVDDGNVLAILDACRDALSEPPRQCDIGTEQEQHCRFIEYCNACDCPMGCIHRKQFIGMLDTRCASMLKCYIRWAQIPYEAEEGGEK